MPAGRKHPPPRGSTGWAGVDPSGADVQAWIDGPEGAGNIALHLGPVGGPAGDGTEIIGIDVDAYGGKGGAGALAELTERAECELPPTWVSTARDDGVSGIRFYRAALPAGRVWVDQPAGTGAGIEMIHRGHRYAVVWPSEHPDGGTYHWWQPARNERRSDGSPWPVRTGTVPRVDWLPALPAAWVEVLSRPGEVIAGSAADHASTLAAVDAFRRSRTDGPAVLATGCPPVGAARARALAVLEPGRVSGEALHPTANGHLWELVSLGFEGHRGVREALAVHYGAFLAARGDVRGEGRDVAEAEWWRMVRGAVGKASTRPVPLTCDCEAGLFDPGRPPGGLSGGVAPDWWREGVAPDAGPFAGAATDTPTGDVESGVSSNGVLAGQVDPVEWLLGQLLSPAQVRVRPAPLPLVAGLLALDSVAWLVAAPGSYKSFVALDLAAAVAAGRPWLGRRTHQGPVIYLAAEGAGGLALRVRAHEHRHGEMSEDVRILPMPLQASAWDQWGALIEVCRRVKPALIVIDTQARVTVGMKENDNTDMGLFVDAAERLRASCDACVLVIHHTPKDGAGLRGASALVGAAGTVLELRKRDTGQAVLTAEKQKDMPDDSEINIALERVALGVDEVTGDALSSLAVLGAVGGSVVWSPDWSANLTENQAMLIGVMADLFPERGATKAEVKRAVMERLRPSDRKQMPKQSYDRAWDGVTGASEIFIQVKGTQRYVLGSLHTDTEDRPTASQVLSALGEWHAPE